MTTRIEEIAYFLRQFLFLYPHSYPFCDISKLKYQLSGMLVHPTRRELFVAVPGKNRILKIQADSGRFARTAREEYPIFSNRLPSFEYSIWECVENSIFVPDIKQPTGMALSLDGERLFVAERGTGMIHAYEIETGALLYTIPTQFETIGGMAFAPNGGELYFVDDKTNSLNSVKVLSECGVDYAPRTDPKYSSALRSATVALGVANPFDLIAETCTVNPIVPNATLFDQVHVDTGYASDNPDVQSVMAGMDAAAALLANRTDCEYDSELNFDALLLGGYFCHICLPNQDQTCGGGGSCINVQWSGYICDNEFKIVPNEDSGLPDRYLLQTMNGTDVDVNELVLKAGITYKFYVDTEDEEICLSTRISQDVALSRTPEADSDRLSKIGLESLTLGCATKGSLVFSPSQSKVTDLLISVNVVGQSNPIVSLRMKRSVTSGAAKNIPSLARGWLFGSAFFAALVGFAV